MSVHGSLPDRRGRRLPVVGVLLDSMGDQYQAGVMRGLLETALSAGVSLLCFAGGPLRAAPGRDGARQRLYDACSGRNVDGMVVLGSTLIHGVGASALAHHCERHRPLPICSIGVDLPGFPSLTVENEAGVRSLLEHSIREHGARRIALVRGPLANAEAELRVAAYRQTLEAHQIPIDERLIVTGNFQAESGASAVRALASVPGLRLEELDAILASNDAMAIGVLSALEHEQIAVPGQVAVLGFDDVDDARVTQPPLTTVRQPLERLGQEALRMTLDWIRQGVAPTTRRLVTEPVIRRSCGCARPSGRAGPSLGPERSLGFEAALLMKRERIIVELTRVARGSFSAAGSDWADRLVNALAADLRNPDPSAFVSAFDALLERLEPHGVDLNLCDDVLGALRARVVPLLRNDRARSERAEDLFHLCRLATSHTIQRSLLRDRLYLGRWSLALNATCSALGSSVTLGELEQAAARISADLGVRGCRVVAYDEGGARARLLFGGDGERRGLSFDPALLVPGGTGSLTSAGASFVVLPLVHRDELLGHLLLELDLRHAHAYGAIADALGVGLHYSRAAGTVAGGA